MTAPVLWPRLTPAASTRPRSQACCPQTAELQVSPGENADFPCTLAPFSLPALDCVELRRPMPTRPTDPASHGVCVPQVAGLPPASFAPHLAVTHLPLASPRRSRRVGAINLRDRDAHSQVSARAGRTQENRPRGRPVWVPGPVKGPSEDGLGYEAAHFSPTSGRDCPAGTTPSGIRGNSYQATLNSQRRFSSYRAGSCVTSFSSPKLMVDSWPASAPSLTR